MPKLTCSLIQIKSTALSILSLSLLAGCLETPTQTSSSNDIFQQFSQKYIETRNLANTGNCDDALKSYDYLVKTYQDRAIASHSLVISSNSLSKCLMDSGRAIEIVKQFEEICTPGRTSNIDLQKNVCTETNLQGAAPAYKLVERENPFANSDVAKQIVRNHQIAIEKASIELKNIEYTRVLQSEKKAIFDRIVTQRPGSNTETRRFYAQSKAAATEVIAFIDAQIPKCQADNNDYCLKFLANDRRANASYLVEMSAKLNESLEDQAAAQRIAAMAPSILSAIGTAGANYAAANPIKKALPTQTNTGSNGLGTVGPPVTTYSANPYANNSTSANSATGVSHNSAMTGASLESGLSNSSARKPYKRNANSCIALRGNNIANNCSETVYISFCVLNPKQTKNFFDASDAFKCPNGGLESISGNGINGLVWHGWIKYFACFAKDNGSGGKVEFFVEDLRNVAPGMLAGEYSGSYHGLCGGHGADGRLDIGGSFYAK